MNVLQLKVVQFSTYSESTSKIFRSSEKPCKASIFQLTSVERGSALPKYEGNRHLALTFQVIGKFVPVF